MHAHGGAGRRSVPEQFAVDGVEGFELGRIGEVGVDLDQAIQAGTGGFEHGAEIAQCLAHLVAEVGGDLSVGVGGDLPGGEHQMAGDDGLGVGTDRLRAGEGGGDALHGDSKGPPGAGQVGDQARASSGRLKVSVSRSRATRDTPAEAIRYQATDEPLPVAESRAVVTMGVAALPSRPESM